MIATREWIDFADFNTGIGKLHKYVHELDLPVGQLRLLKERLADAEHDLRRATGEDADRIKAEIDDLNKQIETQKKIAENPKAAEEQTQANIAAGLERERQSKESAEKKTYTKFINPPPGIAPTYFQDRTAETGEIVRFLHDDAQRLMTIVGRGGVEKTAMVCRLLKGLEEGELPNGLGEMQVDGIVYLSESGSHRVNFANLFYDLCKLLPADAANALDAIYKNPQASAASKMSALLDRFTVGKVVLLLDNVELLISVETFDIADAELDECLRALLRGVHSALKVILTTRVAPRGLNLCEPGRQRVLTLDSGLEQKYAIEMLREMDVDGKLGLKSADPEQLKRTYERTLGFPRALEALFAILASDRYTTLEELLAMATPVNVVEALVGEAFNRLDMNAQKVMQALAVYNRPVTPAAVDYLLAPHIPAMDSAPILQRLANMHFARKESGRFYLHPVDREFVFELIPETLWPSLSEIRENSTSQVFDSLQSGSFTQTILLNHAANYFKKIRKPRSEWKKLSDISAQLAEFDLRYAARDYDVAAELLSDIDFDCLIFWGHYSLMIDLHLKLRDKIIDPYLRMGNLNGLGFSHYGLGKLKEAIYFYQKGLEIARESNELQAEGALLGNLGSVYANLGNVHLAIELYKQALAIARKVDDYRNEGVWLGSLANRYADLGDINQALELYVDALSSRRKIQDRRGEAVDIENLGHAQLFMEEYQMAVKNFNIALQIANEISLEPMKQYARWGLAKSYLFQTDLTNARTIIESALQYEVPQNNHNASTLHGIIALRQGDASTAHQAVTHSISQAAEILAKTFDYYDALDAKGLALCGLMLSTDDSHLKDDCHLQAIETFRKARKIAPHVGIVKRNLRLFDELAKCDEEGILKDVRNAAEGKE
jgi:tetratricopeptide (TPR) repeat protein